MHRLLMHSWNIFQRYRQRISEYYDSNFHYRFFHDVSIPPNISRITFNILYVYKFASTIIKYTMYISRTIDDSP